MNSVVQVSGEDSPQPRSRDKIWNTSISLFLQNAAKAADEPRPWLRFLIDPRQMGNSRDTRLLRKTDWTRLTPKNTQLTSDQCLSYLTRPTLWLAPPHMRRRRCAKLRAPRFPTARFATAAVQGRWNLLPHCSQV